jgi:NAD(P)H-dependent flavin oxidoreductase YrpB (nitropropane dioxygenase family)
MNLPVIIQCGMGVQVSSWNLAREVSRAGQLGVVSGTALDLVVARRLQDGDASGDIRRAISHFPIKDMADRVIARYFIEGGRPQSKPYIPVPTISLKPNQQAIDIQVVGNFVEVFLAKEGHDGIVGINFLEKVQMATPHAAYGAMLAGVDYVLMGAGIPAEIPSLLNRLSRHEKFALAVDVDDASVKYFAEIDPQTISGGQLPPLKRPQFLAIVSAHVLAAFLNRDEATRPDGFVIEGPTAGGHNTPPRSKEIDENGEPVFGPRDEADLAKVSALGLPFWLAGGRSTPELVQQAIESGAAGVQVGTVFALCENSGFTPHYRNTLRNGIAEQTLYVKTDRLASPTGFPFKVAQVQETVSNDSVYKARPRLCDLGYLRTAYERSPGVVGYRCPSEPIDMYIKKGGTIEDTEGRMCLCNGLTVTIGIGQTRADGYSEAPLMTLGSDLGGALQLTKLYPQGWTAVQAIDYMLGK